jgi:hypothetical protein
VFHSPTPEFDGNCKVLVEGASAGLEADMANTEAMKKIHFSVKGMTCGGCVRSVQRILDNVDGILNADVQE